MRRKKLLFYNFVGYSYSLFISLKKVQEMYSKKLTWPWLLWSGAHWRKIFSTGENEKNTNDENCSSGDFMKTAYSLIIPLEPE